MKNDENEKREMLKAWARASISSKRVRDRDTRPACKSTAFECDAHTDTCKFIRFAQSERLRNDINHRVYKMKQNAPRKQRGIKNVRSKTKTKIIIDETRRERRLMRKQTNKFWTRRNQEHFVLNCRIENQKKKCKWKTRTPNKKQLLNEPKMCNELRINWKT